MIDEGLGLVPGALMGGGPGPYALQAAIAAIHDESDRAEDTDWPQIVALYDVLCALAPSPIVALNRAVAVAMRDGPAAGLALLEDLADEPRLRDHHPYAAARAELLHRLGRRDEAAELYRRALNLAGTVPERRYLEMKLSEITAR